MTGDFLNLAAWVVALGAGEFLLLRVLGSNRRPGLRALPIAVLVASAVLMAQQASATTTFVAPTQWSRDDAAATYYEWDVFTMQPGATFPFTASGLHPADVAAQGPGDTGATLEEKTQTGLITSSANIYSFAAATEFDLIIPAYALGDNYYTTVILQASAQGSPLDPSTVQIVGPNEEIFTPSSTQTLFKGVLPSSIGDVDVEEMWFQWNLPTTFGSLDNLLVQFGASESSMSLANVAIDTYTSLEPVVEPTPAGAGGPSADFNSDGNVDLADFNILKSNFGQGGTLESGDANGDEAVDLQDFNILKSEFGATGSAAVPEPATIVMALCGALALGAVGPRTARGRK